VREGCTWSRNYKSPSFPSSPFPSASPKHLREWLFHSGTGVGERNYSGVGVRLGTGVGTNNRLGVDSGVEFYCLNFALALASNT
jgi:hypothetical protein